ncbi:MAG: nucleotide-binding protein [Clostridia bacterium]|nr:nucleotide-binding protein [Clostridia bacterium]
MKIFIGSSVEEVKTAVMIGSWLEKEGIDVNVWNEVGIFTPGQYSLDDLIKQTKEVDAAVFIFSGDDRTWYRHDIVNSVRDNILFEFGLFCGELSFEKVAIVTKGSPKLASDLSGITYINLDTGKNTAQERLINWVNKVNPDGKRVPKLSVYADSVFVFDEKGYGEQTYTVKYEDGGCVVNVDYTKQRDAEPAYSGVCINCVPQINLTANKLMKMKFDFLDSGLKCINLEIKNRKVNKQKSITIYPDMVKDGWCEIDLSRLDEELLRNIDEFVLCTKPDHFTDQSNKKATFKIDQLNFES